MMALRSAMLRNTLPPVIVVLILIIALLIYDAHRSPTVFCYGSAASSRQGLTPMRTSTVTTTRQDSSLPPTTLPPSRDNDAGISRQRDATPDADTDTYQSAQFCIQNGRLVKGH